MATADPYASSYNKYTNQLREHVEEGVLTENDMRDALEDVLSEYREPVDEAHPRGKPEDEKPARKKKTDAS